MNEAQVIQLFGHWILKSIEELHFDVNDTRGYFDLGLTTRCSVGTNMAGADKPAPAMLFNYSQQQDSLQQAQLFCAQHSSALQSQLHFSSLMISPHSVQFYLPVLSIASPHRHDSVSSFSLDHVSRHSQSPLGIEFLSAGTPRKRPHCNTRISTWRL